MSFAYTQFVAMNTTIASSAGAVYTKEATGNPVDYLRWVIIHNANTTAETVELWLVPGNSGSAGTAADTNKIYKESLGAGETRLLDFGIPGLILTTDGDSLQAKTTTASKVTIQVQGARETI